MTQRAKKQRAHVHQNVRRTITLAAIATVLAAGACSSPDTDDTATTTPVTPTQSPQGAATGSDLTPDPSPTAETEVPGDAPGQPDPGQGAPAEGEAPPPPPPGRAPAQAPPPAAQFNGHAGPQSQPQGADTFLSVTGVRIGEHAGYTRIVIDMAGQGNQPGYSARYVDAAYEAGSGNLRTVAGDRILQVDVSGWGYPFDTGVDEYAGPRTIGGPASGSVAQVQLGTFYEGVAQFFIGVRGSDKPYRVSVLQEPTRVVIDVAD